MKYTASKKQKKAILARMHKAGENGDFKVYQKCSALILIFADGLGLLAVAERLGRSYEYVRSTIASFLLEGMRSLKIKRPIGRQPKLSKTQCLELCEMVNGLPSDFGYSGGCWNAAMIADLIRQRFGVQFSVKYLPELLRRIGLSYRKANFIAAKACPEKRDVWINKTWPKLERKAKRNKEKIYFGDESSFALWGSLAYTWGKRGGQKLIPTNGNRKAAKIFGMIEYFSGKLVSKVVDERLNGESYVAYLKLLLKSTRGKINIVQDGAPYHRAKIVKAFFEKRKDRIEAYQLPSYSPDFNPIECLWRKIKRGYTHNVFFECFEDLVSTIENALDSLATDPKSILGLMGKYKT